MMRLGLKWAAIGVFGCFLAVTAAFPQHAPNWIDSWAAVADSAGPPLQDKTVRQVIRTSIGGTALRVRLSNLFGSGALNIGPATIAKPAKTSAIQSGSIRRLTFKGQSTVVIPKGADVLSDPVEYRVNALQELAISFYVPNAATTSIHGVGMQTAYMAAGELTSAPALPIGDTDDSRYLVTDLEVTAPAKSHALVVVGDSITDGVGSTEDASARWPDALAARLQADPELASISVVNAGVAGNRILHDGSTPYLGPSLLSRFDRDVLAKPGVKWILLLEGINDISASDTLSDAREHVSAEQIIGGMQQLIQRAHAHGIKIWGATLLPYENTVVPPKVFQGPFHTAAGEAKRQVVNHWIRTAHAFDAVIDFDKVMRDPVRIRQLRPDLDSGDHLHPNDAGYKDMAAAIDRQLFLTGT